MNLFITDKRGKDVKNKEIKLSILGPPVVGKSCCTSRHFKNLFHEEYIPTLEEMSTIKY